MLCVNFIDTISEISGLAHKSAYKISFSQRLWSIISEILPKFPQDLTTDIGSKINCSYFGDFMPVLQVHRVITHAFSVVYTNY